MQHSPRILRTSDAAAYVGLSASALEKMRCRGGGPEFVRLGPRAVGYRVEDLDAWVDDRHDATCSRNAAGRPRTSMQHRPRSS